MNRLSFLVPLVVCGLSSCETRAGSPGGSDQIDTMVGDTSPSAEKASGTPRLRDDLYGVIVLRQGSLILAEIDTTRTLDVPNIGFALTSLDNDSLVAVSASGSGSLEFLRGRLTASALESLTRPRDDCRHFPLIEAEVLGEQDSAVFVRRGSLTVAGSRVLLPHDSLYRYLEDVARAHERERDVFRNKVVAQRVATVRRIVLMTSVEGSYATVTLSRADDDLETGGRQDFTAILRADATSQQYVAEGDIHSEGDGEGKGHESLRVLFITTDAADRPVLVTEKDYWGGSGGSFFVRLAHGQWREFGEWGSGC